MPEVNPTVSLGLPVYNGANYLSECLQSLLAQTCDDFELIISDNASTDETQAICERFARDDPRILYVRQEHNLGAAANYNAVFELARGRYFKWSAHDDLYEPTFLERCVAVLDEREDVAVAFTLCREIDEAGNLTRTYPARGAVDKMPYIQRFSSMVVGRQPFIPVFGVIRTEVLARTKLIGKFAGSDRPLIGELALRGNMVEIPDALFCYRVHGSQSWGNNKSRREQQAWYDPRRKGKRTFPTWRLLVEHEHTIWRVPMGVADRIQLHFVMAKWIRRRWRRLLTELAS